MESMILSGLPAFLGIYISEEIWTATLNKTAFIHPVGDLKDVAILFRELDLERAPNS